MKCTHENVEGFIAMHSVSNLWYVLRNESIENRRKCLKIICLALTVCSANHIEVYNAVKNEKFNDFEDCLQEACAYQNKIYFDLPNNERELIIALANSKENKM